MRSTATGRPESADTLVGRRSGARARLSLPATLESVRGLFQVRILNLSCTGAMVQVPEPLKVGSDAVLQRGALDALGVVVWAGSGRCGLQFDEPLTEEEVILHRRVSEQTALEPDKEALASARRWASGNR